MTRCRWRCRHCPVHGYFEPGMAEFEAHWRAFHCDTAASIWARTR